MQIDVNSAADRGHLMRAQLTSVRSAQSNAKPPVSTDRRALTDLASAPSKLTDFASAPAKLTDVAPTPGSLTDVVWAPSKRISDARANPSVTRTNPTPEPTVRGATDLGSLTQTESNSPAVTDRQPATPVDRVDALLADWGQSDSPYDLDGNGTVGAVDLLMLLARLSDGPQQPEPSHVDVAGPARPSARALAEPQLTDPSHPTPAPPNDLDALLADWGQSDSPYDFDGNGIVGAADLLMLLAKISGGGSQPQEPHGDGAQPRQPSAHVLAEPPAQPNPPHNPAIASGKQVASGVNATTIVPPKIDGSTPRIDRFDRHHDGASSRSELARQIRDILMDHIAVSPNATLDQFVREAMKQLSDHDNRNGAGERDPVVQRSSRAYQRMNLEELAHKLMQRLTDYGPSDLANFVQSGKLSANDTKLVLDRISMLSPNKLGVNTVG